MKRALAVMLLVGAAVTLTGASCCTLERNAIKEVEATHDIILPEYIEYVTKDAAKTQDQKNDRVKLTESLRRVVEALKKQTD